MKHYLLTGAILCAASLASADSNLNRIQAVSGSESGDQTIIRVRGTSTPTFTVYKLDEPARIVVDIASAELDASLLASKSKAIWNLNTWGVNQVTADPRSSSARKSVRLTVGLARASSYKVRASGNSVLVRVTPRELRPASRTSSAARSNSKQTIAKLKAERDAAITEAGRARNAQERAETLVRDSNSLRKQAALELTRARQDAAEARRQLTKLKKSGSSTTAGASKSKQSERLLKDADKKLAAAEAAKNEARNAEKRALDRERRAAAAERRARQEAKAAAGALAEAKSLRRKARAATGADATRFANAAKSAEATATQRAQAAEKARDLAESKRAQAEQASSAAERRRATALRAAAAAERQKNEALAKSRSADAASRVAIERTKHAEAELKALEKRATELKKTVAAAERQAKRAAELRTKEERALTKASAGREKAERHRRQALLAASKVDASLSAIANAESEIQRLRASSASTARAEARLADLKKDLEFRRKESSRLSKHHEKARANLQKLQHSTDTLRSQREGEEANLANLVASKKRIERAHELALADKQRKLSALQKRTADVERRRSAAESALKKAKSELAEVRTGGTRVRDIDLIDDHGNARVVIAMSGPTAPKVLKNNGRQAVLLIPKVQMPADLERTLDTSQYKGPVKAISSYRDPRSPGDVRVVVDLKKQSKGQLKRLGNTYYWDFGQSRAATTASARTYPGTKVGGYGKSAPVITQSSLASGKSKKVYGGRKIDLDFKDADIHNLLRLLADVGGVNIVIPDNIKARITVRLRRVPWDQAMEVILASKGLGFRREGSLVRVAPMKVLAREERAERARKRAKVQAEAPEAEIFTLNYAGAGALRGQVNPLLSRKGRIQVDPRTNSLIINDVRANRRRIVDLLQRLDTQTPQIQIEARIVEARSSFKREFGIQWGGNFTAGAGTGNATGLVFPASVDVAGASGAAPNIGVAAVPDYAVNLPVGIGTGSGGGLGFSFGSVGGTFNLNLRLSALEDTGILRIVSSPKVTVVNNTSANISQGVSIPISVVSANGAATSFVKANLALTVKPHVSQRDCSVTLDVRVTKNEADFANTGARGDPSILTKVAKTKVIVGDGETTVIGGIYTRNTGRSYSKVPFFADLPVIGYFFKNRRENDDRTEVLVFITPKITNRAFLRCE